MITNDDANKTLSSNGTKDVKVELEDASNGKVQYNPKTGAFTTKDPFYNKAINLFLVDILGPEQTVFNGTNTITIKEAVNRGVGTFTATNKEPSINFPSKQARDMFVKFFNIAVSENNKEEGKDALAPSDVKQEKALYFGDKEVLDVNSTILDSRVKELKQSYQDNASFSLASNTTSLNNAQQNSRIDIIKYRGELAFHLQVKPAIDGHFVKGLKDLNVDVSSSVVSPNDSIIIKPIKIINGTVLMPYQISNNLSPYIKSEYMKTAEGGITFDANFIKPEINTKLSEGIEKTEKVLNLSPSPNIPIGGEPDSKTVLSSEYKKELFNNTKTDPEVNNRVKRLQTANGTEAVIPFKDKEQRDKYFEKMKEMGLPVKQQNDNEIKIEAYPLGKKVSGNNKAGAKITDGKLAIAVSGKEEERRQKMKDLEGMFKDIYPDQTKIGNIKQSSYSSEFCLNPSLVKYVVQSTQSTVQGAVK